jgi:hypothetical protein
MLRLYGIVLILHGFAHAGAGMWANGPVLVVTPFWWFATLGFVASGLGALGLDPFRRRVAQLVFASALASVMLMYFFVHPLMVPAVVLDVVLATAATQRRLAAKLDAMWDKRGHHPVWSAVALLLLLYATAVMTIRPWAMRMGTTEADRSARLFGDSLYPDARYLVDNAITIRAPLDSVWPWLVQIGQDRGGFYSYQSLENAMGARIHNVDSIVPAWQARKTGDLVRAVPPDFLGGRLGRDIGWHIIAIDSGRAMVLENWGAFVLRPIDSATTRFHIRQRNPGRPSVLATVIAPLGLFVFEPAHFIMQRGMLQGVRDRAEAQIRGQS